MDIAAEGVKVGWATGSGSRGERVRARSVQRWKRRGDSGSRTPEQEWQRTRPRQGRCFYNRTGREGPLPLPSKPRNAPANGDQERWAGSCSRGSLVRAQSRYFLGLAGTFRGFLEGPSSAYPRTLSKAGSHVREDRKRDLRGPWHCAKGAWAEEHEWEG